MAPPLPAARRLPWPLPFCIAALLLVHAWLALSAARQESTTVDEMAHLTAGHALWTHHDYRLQPENGVLPQLWEGLPAVLQGRRLPPPSADGWHEPNVWTLGHIYFHRLGNDLGALLFGGRAMNLAWSLATGVLVFAWTRRLFGTLGGAVALVAWAFCPTFLAHGALATSDMAMTFCMLASVGAFWRHLHDARPATWLLSAMLVGLAFVTKYSAVLLPVMFVPLVIARWLSPEPFMWRTRPVAGRWSRFAWVAASTLTHVVVAVGIIWLFHACRFAPVADPGLIADYTRPWATVLADLHGTRATLLEGARRLHVLPDAYLYGFAFVVDLSEMRGAFLNGMTSMTGWVSFFPYAFAVKTPLGLLAAAITGGTIAILRWRNGGPRVLRHDAYRAAPLFALFGVYWAFSLTSHLNIGQRHLLPTYPVVFIAIGSLGWAISRCGARWAGISLVLLGAHVGASFAVRPHYLAFFNRLAGGPAEGYRHLVDSSLDWGQDLPGLAAWLHAPDLSPNDLPTYLAYFGTGDPEYYGIHSIPMVPLLRSIPGRPWYALEPGLYCVSATLLQQAYSPIRGPWSATAEAEYQKLHALESAFLDFDQHPGHRRDWEAAADPDRWSRLWQRYEQLRFTRLCYLLRARNPDHQVGYSINIYRLSAQDIRAATGTAKEWVDAIEAAQRSRIRR